MQSEKYDFYNFPNFLKRNCGKLHRRFFLSPKKEGPYIHAKKNMYAREHLLQSLESSTHALSRFFSSVDEKDFNDQKGNGWTIGETAEHIVLLERLVNEGLPFAHVSSRDPLLKIEPVKSGLQNLTQRFAAPDFIVPAKGMKDQQDLVSQFLVERKKMLQLLSVLDLNETVDYRHPVIGSMTRLEWGYFIVHHAERHLAQMNALQENRV